MLRRGDARIAVGAPEVPPERPVVALAKHLLAQPAAGGYAEAVRILPVSDEERSIRE